MEIHKPHPWHGWREFLKEIFVIVCGVLIAIALEQTVEALHHRSQAREMLHKLHDESVKNRRVVEHDLGVCRAGEALIDRSVAVFSSALQAGRLPAPPEPGPDEPLLLPADVAWLTIHDSALLPIMPKLTADNYGKLEIVPDLIRSLAAYDTQTNVRLQALILTAHRRPMDQAAAGAVRRVPGPLAGPLQSDRLFRPAERDGSGGQEDRRRGRRA